ncbi:MAG: sugar ABC transporter permease [Actinomycetia bacterium]|nr:sugar ABC transporter permease [Actinomycetes bacterium]
MPTTPRNARPGAKPRFGNGAWVLLLPALLPILALSVYPLLRGVYLGFTDARAGYNIETSFIGLDNYREMMSDDLFWESFRIGLIWTVSVTGIQFFLALGLALLLNLKLRGRWLARTLAVVPWAMPPVVVGIMWSLVYRPDAGLLNEILYRIGLEDLGANWLGDFGTALPAVIVVGVWAGLPVTTVVLLAALQGVPHELNEAAAIDGAGAWLRFKNIVWPHLRSVVAAITTLNFIWNFNSFDLVYVLTKGGPGGKTTLPMLFAYDEAFRYGNYGYAAALGNVMVLIVLVFILIYLRRRLKEST